MRSLACLNVALAMGCILLATAIYSGIHYFRQLLP